MKKTLSYFSLVVFLFCANTTIAQVPKFQALYLLNFANKMEWSQNNIKIGVIGNSKVIDELTILAEKYPNTSIKQMTASDPVSDCQLIFLPESQTKNFNSIQSKIGNAPIVLVTENSKMVTEGSEISFYMEGNKLKFTINKTALDASGVKAPERLLSVANVIN